MWHHLWSPGGSRTGIAPGQLCTHPCVASGAVRQGGNRTILDQEVVACATDLRALPAAGIFYSDCIGACKVRIVCLV